MEMCYDGSLIMPKNYAVVSSEEMSYVDGGTAQNFVDNLKGLWNKSTVLRHALKAGGFSWGYIGSLVKCSYWYIVGTVSAKLGVTISLVSRTLAVVAVLGAVAATIYVWNNRLWY